MLKIAVVTSYFPSSTQPWQGRSAYQTLRVIAREADVRVFYPTPRIHPSSSHGLGVTTSSTLPTVRLM